MPSYTFVSTANAFVLRGAVPVFVEIRSDTLNLDEDRIEAAITHRTRAIVPVHYGGVACDMKKIMLIAERHGLLVIEDAAQGVMAYHFEQPLGTMGHMGTLSFHETKNIISGEGGALLINDPELIERAEVIREKGTNRKIFSRGQVDKYTWIDVGSSYLPNEITSAFLFGQLQDATKITKRRLTIWKRYHTAFRALESSGRLRRPFIPEGCKHNGHIYYLLMNDGEDRANFIASMQSRGITCAFHYVPLHSAPIGQLMGRVSEDLIQTEELANCLVRLPLWVGLEEHLDQVIEKTSKALL